MNNENVVTNHSVLPSNTLHVTHGRQGNKAPMWSRHAAPSPSDSMGFASRVRLDCTDKSLALTAKLKMTHCHLNAQPSYNDRGLEREFVSNCRTHIIHTPIFSVYGQFVLVCDAHT